MRSLPKIKQNEVASGNWSKMATPTVQGSALDPCRPIPRSLRYPRTDLDQFRQVWWTGDLLAKAN